MLFFLATPQNLRREIRKNSKAAKKVHSLVHGEVSDLSGVYIIRIHQTLTDGQTQCTL